LVKSINEENNIDVKDEVLRKVFESISKGDKETFRWAI
jgi:hypothetical protein